MIPNDPLCLPEIQLLVAQYLEDRDLTECIRVCKLWHVAFLPCLWEDLTLKYRFIDERPIGPLLNALQRNRQLVKVLRMQSAFSTNYAISYPRLHTLNLRMVDIHDRGPIPTIELEQEYDPTPLIRLNPSIVNLSLEFIKGPYSAPFWRAVADLTNLKNLEIRDSVIDINTANDFWRLFTMLNKLVVIRSSVVRSGTIPPMLTYPQLQTLELDQIDNLDGVAQMDLIHRCSELESLTWRPHSRIMIHISGQFTRDLTAGKWPNLTRLSLTNPISDVDLAAILSGMSQAATELKLDRSGFGERALEVLKRRHSATIVSLNIAECQVSDQEEVFNRLSRLVQLEDLNIGNRERRLSMSSYRGLRFKLEFGVGALASLKRIKYLSWSYIRQNLVMEDIEWMLQNWKRLKQVTGILHTDDTIGNPLREKLKAHGVLVLSITPV
ncbi:hypothetical protein BGX20_001972 [Mortierella sp. AD010]|nr:hypothetical protein BGX20_001972 [Mortierella sp. AD010]